MLFASYALFFSILLFVTLYVAAKWCFKKSWLNNILLVGGNILILTQIVSWKSLFLLSLLSLLAYGVGLLLRKRKSGWVLGLALSLLILLFAVRNYPLVQSWLGGWWTDTMGKHFLSVEKLGLSYILFRIIHWLVESYKGTLRTRDFLNADTSIHAAFSVIAGAGRTPCTYFPLIQSNKHVKNLKVIFFLNPSYGCGKLASSNVDYFHRYVSYTVYSNANKPKNQDVENILKVNMRPHSILNGVGDALGYYSDKLRRKYYQDLVFRLDNAKFYESLTWLDSNRVYKIPQSCARPDADRYNYQLNVGANFDVHSYTLWPHPEEPYRYDELRTMIRLCKERGVDVTFVAGPYNSIAYQNVHPSELPKIQEVSKKMLQVLEEEGAEYIDCTDLSTVPGVFADWQHHTSYGGFLIYQKIRDYVLEKESR